MPSVGSVHIGQGMSTCTELLPGPSCQLAFAGRRTRGLIALLMGTPKFNCSNCTRLNPSTGNANTITTAASFNNPSAMAQSMGLPQR